MKPKKNKKKLKRNLILIGLGIALLFLIGFFWGVRGVVLTFTLVIVLFGLKGVLFPALQRTMMTRFGPMIMVSLKSFFRDKKSVLILIVFPLIVIGTVFTSFNIEGTGKLPIGIVVPQGDFDLEEFRAQVRPFFYIVQYDDLDHCLLDLRAYRRYSCVEPIVSDIVKLNVYYDNTRDPIIWEVIQTIDQIANTIETQKSTEAASDFIGRFNDAMVKLDQQDATLQNEINNMYTYIDDTGDAKTDLQMSKQELSSTLNEMDQDLAQVRTEKNSVAYQKQLFYWEAISTLNYIDSMLAIIGQTTTEDYWFGQLTNEVDQLKNEVESYNNQFDTSMSQMDTRLANYEQRSTQGRNYLTKIDSGVGELNDIEHDLTLYQGRMQNTRYEIADVKNDFYTLQGVEPNELVSPVVIQTHATYTGPINKLDEPIKPRTVLQLKQQIQFPVVLIVIVILLSLLIASFVTLKQINTLANQRIKLVPGIFFQEFFAVYISAMLILVLPVLFILLFGNYVYKLPIVANFGVIMLIFFLVCSAIALTGIIVAYLVKTEAMTLQVIPFVLFFMIFFSGVLLPVERMSPLAGFFASIGPAKLGLNAFNKIVFYNLSFNSVSGEVAILVFLVVFLILLAFVVKKIRKA